MVGNITQHISKAVEILIEKSVTTIPNELKIQLNQLAHQLEEDDNKRSSSQLKLMLENLDYAENERLPICQDTGIPTFFIHLGLKSPYSSILEQSIKDAIIKSTENGKLRPNSVDPITNKNPGNNLGVNTPPIYYEIADNDEIIINILNKGGGAENYSALFMLSASTGLNDLEEAIIKRITEAGGKPCPPIIVGIGLGGDASKSMYLAKKSLLREIRSSNPRSDVAALEKKICDRLNKLEIGVMGLHGKGTCLAVHCELAMRHPASFPVGIIVQCYVHRSYSMRVLPSGKVEYGRLDGHYQFKKEE